MLKIDLCYRGNSLDGRSAEPRTSHGADAKGDRQPRRGRSAGRQAMGRANSAFHRLFQYRPGSDASRNDHRLRHLEESRRRRESCRQKARRRAPCADRSRLRRNPRRQARRHVPTACLDDRQRHAVQHERQRGDRQPLLAVRRQAARQQGAGPSQRSRQHVAIVERHFPGGDVHRRGGQCERAPHPRGRRAP